MAWIAWENICLPKSEERMGFKDLKAFNLALLAKQGWWIIQTPDSLLHRVFKAKYFARFTFMEAQLGKKSLLTCGEVSWQLGRPLRWVQSGLLGMGEK